MSCMTCKGKGTIYRPVRKIVQEIVRHSECIDGQMFEQKEIVITEAGGIDLCPVCVAEAEADYKSHITASKRACLKNTPKVLAEGCSAKSQRVADLKASQHNVMQLHG